MEYDVIEFVVGVVYVGTAGAHFGVGHDLQDVRWTQFGHSASVVEGEVIGFEILISLTVIL